jgi:hypothetical protein
MEVLVTLKQAKASLKLPIDVTADDKDMQATLDAAHTVAERRIKQRRSDAAAWEAVVDAWDSDSAPRDVIQGIKFLFGYLWRRRGDDVQLAEVLGPTGLPLTAELLLGDYGDRTIA